MQHPTVSGNKRKQPEPLTPANTGNGPIEPPAPLLLRRVARRDARPLLQGDEPEDIDEVQDANGNLEGTIREEPDIELESDFEVPSTQEPPAKRSGSFRLQAKTVFLTYPKCPLEKEDAKAQIENLWRVPATEFIVGRELHQVSSVSQPSTPVFTPFLSATKYIRNTSAQNAAHFANLNHFYHHSGLSLSDLVL